MATRENSRHDDGTDDEHTRDGMGRREFLGTVGTTTAAIAVGGAGTAAAAPSGGRSDLDFSNDLVQDPYFSADLTKAKHDMDWGTDEAGVLQYEDDSGEVVDLGGEVDESGDTANLYTLRADRIDAGAYYEFPRELTYDDDSDTSTDEVGVSALDSKHWATDASGSTGTITVDDADLSGLSHALSVSTSSQAAGDTAIATFDLSSAGSSDATISSDAEKRHLSIVANINTLEAGALVEIAAIDDDGDEKIAKVDPAGDATNADVIATATGQGVVFQEQLADLATTANGDGTFDSIQKVEVRVSEANADLDLAALSVERKSRWSYGSYLKNEDTDDETTETRYTPSGEFAIQGLGTIGDTFSDATLLDVTFPVRVTLSESDLAFEYEFVELPNDPTYDYEFEERGKFEAPAAIDLSWANLTLEDKVEARPARYVSVKTAEGVDDTEFDTLDENETWSDHTSSYSSQGATVELSSTPTTDTVWAYESTILVVESEKEAITSGASSGGGGAAPLQSSGGLFGGSMKWVTAIVAGILGYAGLLIAKARRAA